MKNYKEKLLVIVLGTIIVFLGISFFFANKEDYSELENRYLSKMSISNLDEYVSDHFPFRNEFLIFKNKIEVLFGKDEINGIIIGEDDYLIPKFESFDKKEYIVKTINDFSKNKEVDVMVVPDSILINKDKLPNDLFINEEEDFKYLFDNLETNCINLIDDFKRINEEKDLYYHSDHHWNSFGAYEAYKLYLKDKAIKEDEFVIEKITDDFSGTSSSLAIGLGKNDEMYLFKKDNNLIVEYVNEGIVDNSLYNFEYLEKKDKYSLFLNGNHALIKISNKDINDDSKLVIIKNSYANSFVPFIINNYQEVHVIDMRYYVGSVTDYMNKEGINKALILYNLNNLYSDLAIIKLK